MSNHISQKVNAFDGLNTPEPGFLAGYAFLKAEIKKQKDTFLPTPDRLAINPKDNFLEVNLKRFCQFLPA